MRGHEPLLAMRRAGRVPDAVWLSLDPDPEWRTWPAALGVRWKRYPDAVGSARVEIDPSDIPARLDLRFVVGMVTWVHGSNLGRVEQLHRACAAAGAKRVLSAVVEVDARGEHRTTAMLDTDGIMQGAW